MNINEVHWNFSDNGTKEPAKSRFWNFYNFWTAWNFLMRFSLLCSGEWALSFYMCVFIYIGVPLRSSWGAVSNAFSKSNMNVSTCPVLSKILAQSFITVVNWVSQLCPFLNACCLSGRSLYSSRWAMIFEHTMCSSNSQGTQVKETRR